LECKQISAATYSVTLSTWQAFTLEASDRADREIWWGQINSSGWRKDSDGYSTLRGVAIIPPDNLLVSTEYDGGILTIECDGISKEIHLPSFTDIAGDGFIDEGDKFFDTKLYAGNDGSTYYTSELDVIAKAS